MSRVWIRTTWPLAVLALLPWLFGPARAQVPQSQVNRLEQEVRDLRRELDLQRRRLEELERVAGGGTLPPGATITRPAQGGPSQPRPAPVTPQWISPLGWDKVTPGLAEIEVLALLGPPTSMRVSDDGRQRTLFYAIEIGSSGYLAGNVVLEAGRVTAVEVPRLR